MIRFFMQISGDPEFEVFPKAVNSLKIDYSIKEGRPFISPEVKGSLVFDGVAYEQLANNEEYPDYCPEITLKIVSDCGDELLTKIFLTKAVWDKDNCSVEVEPTMIDPYKCFEDNQEVEVNFLELVEDKVSINLFEGQFETITCTGSGIMNSYEDRFCGDNIDFGWFPRFQRDVYTYSMNEQEILGVTYEWEWVREYVITSQPMPSPWVNIGGNKWVRKPNVYNYEFIDRGYLGTTPTVPNYPQYLFLRSYMYGGSIDNGMKLQDIFESWLNEYCPTLSIRSNFFQWNAISPTNINYVTGEVSDVSNLILFQRSDVKRPQATANATMATSTIKAILDDLIKMFNLKWAISGNILFLEHVSYFEPEFEVDLEARFDNRLRSGTNKYNYDVDNLPVREVFEFMATKNYSSKDFRGTPIVYSSNCAGLGDTKEEKYPINVLFTDVDLCFENPDSDSSMISDNDFVLIATNASGGMIKKDGIIGPPKNNNVLSLAHLMDKFFLHERKFRVFEMNERGYLATTTIRKKIQDPINAISCCDDPLDLSSSLKTKIGSGIVRSGSLDIYSNTLTLELTYR